MSDDSTESSSDGSRGPRPEGPRWGVVWCVFLLGRGELYELCRESLRGRSVGRTPGNRLETLSLNFSRMLPKGLLPDRRLRSSDLTSGRCCRPLLEEARGAEMLACRRVYGGVGGLLRLV